MLSKQSISRICRWRSSPASREDGFRPAGDHWAWTMTDRDEGDKDLSCYGVGDNVMGNLCRLVCAYDLKLSSKVLVKSLHRWYTRREWPASGGHTTSIAWIWWSLARDSVYLHKTHCSLPNLRDVSFFPSFTRTWLLHLPARLLIVCLMFITTIAFHDDHIPYFLIWSLKF